MVKSNGNVLSPMSAFSKSELRYNVLSKISKRISYLSCSLGLVAAHSLCCLLAYSSVTTVSVPPTSQEPLLCVLFCFHMVLLSHKKSIYSKWGLIKLKMTSALVLCICMSSFPNIVTFASFRDENINIPFGKNKFQRIIGLGKVILHIAPM